MFDLGFLELLIVGVIALIILGPERLPGAARAVGQWVGRARRLTRQFTDELDRQVKTDEIREQLRRENSAIGYEDIQKNVQEALDEAKKDEHLILPDPKPRKPESKDKETSSTADTQAGAKEQAPAESDSGQASENETEATNRDMPDEWRSNIPSDRRDS